MCRLSRISDPASLDIIQYGQEPEFMLLAQELETLQANEPHLFCKQLAFIPEMLQKEGMKERVAGVGRKVFETQFNIASNGDAQDIAILPRIHQSWDNFDHTRDIRILPSRYMFGTSFKNNSCALDTVLFAGVNSGAVIRQLDAISFRTILGLSSVQRQFRHILGRAWGAISQTSRDAARDGLKKQILLDYPTVYPAENNGMALVADIIDVCFLGLPSFTYTEINAYVCCNLEVAQIAKKEYKVLRARRRTLITIDVGKRGASKLSMQEMLQNYFRPKQDGCSGMRWACKEIGCKGNPSKVRVVVDRMPPMLVVSLGGGMNVSDNLVRRPFHNVSIEHYTSGNTRIKTATYYVDGAITNVGAHFIARWKGKEQMSGAILHFDCKETQEVSSVQGWVDSLRRFDRITVLFYRQMLI